MAMYKFQHGDMVKFIDHPKVYKVDHTRPGPLGHEVVFSDGTWGLASKLVGGLPPPYCPIVPPTEQAFKADAGKPMWHLLTNGCARALDGVVKVLSFAVAPKDQGGKGYVPHSWKKVPNAIERYESALHRHLNAINRGELVDSESGLSHWDHVATNALFLSELTKSAGVPNVTSSSI